MKAPTHSLHTITLEIRVPRDGETSPPETWDWPTLLDLPDREDVRVVEEAKAEAERLRDALQAISAECSFAPDSENNATVRWVLHTARTALNAEEEDTR